MADTYLSVLTAAVNDLLEHGFTDAERVRRWQEALRAAADASFRSVADLDALLGEQLRATYRRLVERDGALRYHGGVDRFTYQLLKPRLKQELDKRIVASVDLIRLNRQEAMARQLKRFAGWASSIPPGGAAEADRRKLKAEIRKPLARLPFEERRVMIDQGHKLVSSINSVIAIDGGAIAARWRHVHQPGYDARPAHQARDGKVLLVRDSWAHKAGLVAADGDEGFTDDVEQPAELPFCRCSYSYLYALNRLPAGLLTKRGLEEVDRMKTRRAA